MLVYLFRFSLYMSGVLFILLLRNEYNFIEDKAMVGKFIGRITKEFARMSVYLINILIY